MRSESIHQNLKLKIPRAYFEPKTVQLCLTDTAAAEAGLTLITGDKRALLALKDISDFADALAGQIIVIEAILIVLCDLLGQDYVRKRIQMVSSSDTMIRVCFSTGNLDPREALLSYYQDLATELDPLILWNPNTIGEA